MTAHRAPTVDDTLIQPGGNLVASARFEFPHIRALRLAWERYETTPAARRRRCGLRSSGSPSRPDPEAPRAQGPEVTRGLTSAHINQYAQALTAQGTVHAYGRVIAYTEAPTVVLLTDGGEHVSWRADLCERAAPPLEEPGTWGVVEAACCHDDVRRLWYHHPDGNWWPVPPGYAEVRDMPSSAEMAKALAWPDDWASLNDPTIIRDGVPQ